MPRTFRAWGPLLLVLALSGCEPFDPWFDYAADDAKLQYIGRVDASTVDGPTYGFPGVTVRLRCNCTGVDVGFEDLGSGGDEHRNWVNIIVDGQTAAKIELKPGTKPGARQYKGARDLPPGEHTIEIVKRTESYAGNIHFVGVSLQGILLDPPPRPARRMEIIGDSISCGYGNESRISAPNYTEPNVGYFSKNEDISQAYGALLGRRFDSEVVHTCISGTGVYRNNDGSTDRSYPHLYLRVFPDQEEPVWDPSRYVPDVVVINLGNNDFNVMDEEKLPTAPPAEDFKAAYAAFVRELRSLYPAAHIVCSIGPMMNDNYPAGRQHWTKMQQYVREMVDAVHAEGDWGVHYFAYTPILGDPYGDDWHPTAESHAAMARELGDFLEGLGW